MTMKNDTNTSLLTPKPEAVGVGSSPLVSPPSWMVSIMGRAQWPATGDIFLAPDESANEDPHNDVGTDRFWLVFHAACKRPIPVALGENETSEDLLRDVKACRPRCTVMLPARFKANTQDDTRHE